MWIITEWLINLTILKESVKIKWSTCVLYKLFTFLYRFQGLGCNFYWTWSRGLQIRSLYKGDRHVEQRDAETLTKLKGESRLRHERLCQPCCWGVCMTYMFHCRRPLGFSFIWSCALDQEGHATHTAGNSFINALKTMNKPSAGSFFRGCFPPSPHLHSGHKLNDWCCFNFSPMILDLNR